MYINFEHPQWGKETVDEFDSLKEARTALKEYNQLYVEDGHYYLSRRPCANWKDDFKDSRCWRRHP